MKILFAIIALVVVGTVAAQRKANAGPTITDNLIRRGMMLEQTIEYDLFRLDQMGQAYKGTEMRNILVKVQTLLRSLYGQQFDEVSRVPIDQEWDRLERLFAEQQQAVGLAKAQRK